MQVLETDDESETLAGQAGARDALPRFSRSVAGDAECAGTAVTYRELTDSVGDRAKRERVAELHTAMFRRGLGGSLGIEFARAFYDDVIGCPDCFLIVAEIDGTLAGYISGAFDNRVFPTSVFRKRIRRLILRRMLTFRLSYTGLWRAIRNHRLGRSAEGMAELLSIQVCSDFGGKGIGRGLVARMEERFRNRAVPAFCVYTDDCEGIRFYERIGMRPIFKTEWCGVPSACYVKELSSIPSSQ